MSIFGFDSIADMFDGGGKGGSGANYSTGTHEEYVANNPDDDTAKPHTPSDNSSGIGNIVGNFFGGGSSTSTINSGDTLSSIAAANNTTVEALMAANPDITDPNKISAGASINIPGSGGGLFGNNNGVKGAAPTGIMKAAGFVSPMGIVGKLAGWANGLDPENQEMGVFEGRQVYKNDKGMQYSYNFLGMPYEVEVKDGKVYDALRKDASGKYPGEEGYDQSTSGYEKMAAEQRAQGNDAEADRVLEEAETNAQEPAAGDGTGELNIENITNMAIQAGLIASNEEIKAMMADPMKYFADKGMSLSDLISNNALIDPNAEGTSIDPNAEGLKLEGDITVNPELTGETATIDGVTTGTTETYNPDLVADNIAGNSAANVDAVTGTVSDDALIDPNENQIDITGAATGVNEDGTVSVVGEALNDYASINTSMIIDTSTVSGKLLAQKLRDEGENYVDSKATILGQMKIISEEFKGPNGEPVIPPLRKVWPVRFHGLWHSLVSQALQLQRQCLTLSWKPHWVLQRKKPPSSKP